MPLPNFSGPYRATQNLDIHALAKVAEGARIDLRIVLLVRHPRSAVLSAMKRNLNLMSCTQSKSTVCFGLGFAEHATQFGRSFVYNLLEDVGGMKHPMQEMKICGYGSNST